MGLVNGVFIAKRKIFNEFMEFFFPDVLIVNIKFLLPQTGATKATFTAYAVVTKITIITIFNLLRIKTIVGLLKINAFVAKLAAVSIGAIHAVGTSDN